MNIDFFRELNPALFLYSSVLTLHLRCPRPFLRVPSSLPSSIPSSFFCQVGSLYPSRVKRPMPTSMNCGYRATPKPVYAAPPFSRIVCSLACLLAGLLARSPAATAMRSLVLPYLLSSYLSIYSSVAQIIGEVVDPPSAEQGVEYIEVV